MLAHRPTCGNIPDIYPSRHEGAVWCVAWVRYYNSGPSSNRDIEMAHWLIQFSRPIQSTATSSHLLRTTEKSSSGANPPHNGPKSTTLPCIPLPSILSPGLHMRPAASWLVPHPMATLAFSSSRTIPGVTSLFQLVVLVSTA